MMYAKCTVQSARRSFIIRGIAPIFFALSFSLLPMRYALCETSVEATSSVDLIEHAKQYDGKKVAYEGEMIGEIMNRGEFTWININDGQNALGIWLPSKDTKDILHLGNYQTRGDWFRVQGIFHRSCREHGGDLDIHATAITKIKEGSRIEQSLDLEKVRLMINLNIMLFVVIMAMLLLRMYRQRKQKSRFGK